MYLESQQKNREATFEYHSLIIIQIIISSFFQFKLDENATFILRVIKGIFTVKWLNMNLEKMMTTSSELTEYQEHGIYHGGFFRLRNKSRIAQETIKDQGGYLLGRLKKIGLR